MSKKPKVALVTTTKFREIHRDVLVCLVKEEIVWLCANTNLWSTETTYESVMEIANRLLETNNLRQEDYKLIQQNLSRWPKRAVGIVAATHELIEGRLHAVFHLCHYKVFPQVLQSYGKDINSTFAARALKRQALVHNVVYADTFQSNSKQYLNIATNSDQALPTLSMSGKKTPKYLLC